MNKIKGLYAIEFEEGIKIGISEDIRERIKVYGSPWCHTIKSVWAVESEYPRALERYLMVRYAKSIVRNSTEFITGVNIVPLIKVAYGWRHIRPRDVYVISYRKNRHFLYYTDGKDFPNLSKIDLTGTTLKSRFIKDCEKHLKWPDEKGC